MFTGQRTAGQYIRMLVLGTGYAFWLLWEILKANVYVLKLSLSPKLHQKIDPQIVRFKCDLKSEFAKYVLANSITLTPGTVTVQILDDEFVVHAISDETAKSLPGSMEDKVRAIFDYE